MLTKSALMTGAVTAGVLLSAVAAFEGRACAEWTGHHYNLGASASAGYPDGYKLRAAFAAFDDRTRIGLGTSIEYIHAKEPYTVRGYSTWWAFSPPKTDSSWDIWRIFSLDFYYLPYLGGPIYNGKPQGLSGESPQGALYLYASLCPWGIIRDEQTDYNYTSELSIGGVSSHEFGLGYSFGKIMDLKLGYMTIRAKGVESAEISFPAYKHNAWFLGVDLYYGGWFGGRGDRDGWFPAVREAREAAHERRENARPRIYVFGPEKPAPGSTLEISGSGFRSREAVTSVLFSGVPGEVTRLADESLSVRLPGDIAPGPASFRVKTSRGESDARNIFIMPSKPPLLTVSGVGFRDDSGNKILEADEEGDLFFTVSNARGAGKAFGLKLAVSSWYLKAGRGRESPDIAVEKFYDLGDLDGGAELKYSVPVRTGLDLRDGGVIFGMRISEANDFAPDPFDVRIETRRLEPPDLRLVKIEVDDTFEPDRPEKFSVGNGNTVIEPGESVELAVTLVNKGAGEARCESVRAVSGSPDLTFLGAADFNCGNIKPGGWRDLKLAFSVKKNYRGSDELPVKLVVSDSRPRFSRELPLDLKLKRSYPRTELVNIKGKPGDRKPVEMPSFGEELLSIPAARGRNPDAVAVVIGVQNYKNRDVPSVAYALNDARLFREYLVRALGYREGNIILLQDPTKADLEKVFGTSENPAGQLADYVKKGKSDVFIYYTGHGAPDVRSRQAYLVPSDADPDYVKLGGYPLGVFYDNLARLPARRVSVVLDTCFSGQSDGGALISRASPLRVEPVVPGSGKIEVFASSKADEISSWYPEKRHSLFTYFFLKGLQGEADKNGDRSITAAELDEYLSENVSYMARRLHGRRQTPVFNGRPAKVLVAY
ncbi:MAG: protein kinase [Elusimicrobia bacterium]|nr:MAG: protein kinase [Elusimicrobiota bacterium]KAF0155701.1 MAG: protein kinase [Elusimicrobiota bacterium]